MSDNTEQSADVQPLEYLMGIDVQLRRNCSYAILSRDRSLVASGWLDGQTNDERAARIRSLVEEVARGNPGCIAIGIDSPRVVRTCPRKYYADTKRQRWKHRAPKEKGHGRHCEIVIKALGIANPQWTPIGPEIPSDKEWIRVGAALFQALSDFPHVYEVFPSASYALLSGNERARVDIDFSAFQPGPKDMLDACVAALTVGEYLDGNGCALGNADGLGSIILPVDVTDQVPEFMRTIPEELL